MRIRSIKPDFFKDDELAALPPIARLLFVGLWCMADCEGRLEDRPTRIRAEVLPYDECDVDALLSSLHAADFIVRYEVPPRGYIEVRSFKKHQRLSGIEAQKQSEFPASDHPVAVEKQSRSNGEAVEKQPMSRKGREGNRKGKEGSGGAFAPPTLAELSSYITEIGATFTAQKFIDHYEERNWRWGAGSGHPMKDWRRCARKWKATDDERPLFAPRNGRPAPALVGAHASAPSLRDVDESAPAEILRTYERVRSRELDYENPEDARAAAALEAWQRGAH